MRSQSDSPSDQAELDVITKNESLTWQFSKGSGAATSIQALVALLAKHMAIPESEREALCAQ